MAKLDRKDVQIFAENSKETLITEFRTEDPQGFTASFSRDPDVIQNENYSQGWVNDTNNFNTKIYGEDLNAVNYVLSYLLKYLYENGIAEWKSTTTYYQNSICKVEDALYLSLQNDNIGNDPTSTVGYWKVIPLENVSIEDAGSGFSIVKDVTDNVITFKTISVTGYGEITDTGDQLNIDIAGGGGGGTGDAYWGTIRGTITNQTDLMTLINLKQDIFTVDSPLVLTDEQHLTINKATSSVSGYLDYNDFNTFNGKQDALTGFSHSYITNDDEATITPTATNSNIGTNSYPITNTNTLNLRTDNITNQTSGIGYINFTTSIHADNVKARNFYDTYSNLAMATNNSDDVVFDIGDAVNTSTGSYYFNINDNNKFMITDNSIIPRADILPPDDTFDLGSSTKTFTEGHINTIYTQNIFPTTGNTSVNIAAVTIGGDFVPVGSNTFKIGDSNSNYFAESYIKKMYVGEIHIGTGNNNTVWFYTANEFRFENESSSGTVNICSGNSGTSNLGTSNHKWSNVWTEKINGSTYSPSDRDKKENINKRSDETKGKKTSLEIVSNLETYTYNYKDDKDKTIHIGIMAQDLQNEIPECVVDNGESNEKGEHEKDLYIDVMGYVTVLTEAIKQLNAKVEALEARVNELEGNKKELEK